MTYTPPTDEELGPLPEKFEQRCVIDPSEVRTLQRTAHAQGWAAAMASLGEPVAWQPIETAPKSTHAGGNARIEAVYFLAYCPDPDAVDLESCVCVCWWEPLMKKGKGCWYGEGMYPLHPTHWMPLPTPPCATTASVAPLRAVEEAALAPRPHGECRLGHKFKTQCPNMKDREGDTSMTHEHYDCAVCGAHVSLDYDEMR